MGLAGLVPGIARRARCCSPRAWVSSRWARRCCRRRCPRITNDLSPDHLRGRYNAVNTAVFQAAAVVGPVVAGLLLGRHQPAVFVGVLLAGCVAMVVLLLRVERVISPHANGVAGLHEARADVTSG